jgi:type III pantothenate kinase
MSRRRVLIDAGNTRLKWALAEEGRWLAQGLSDYVDWSSLEAELRPDVPCFIASVAGAVQEQRLAGVLDTVGVGATWLTAEAEFSGVKNAYLNPSQLGVDRWMGLIAARQRCGDPVLVVSAGTAMTVDAMAADGVFLGGVILPGATLMRQSLLQGAARIAETSGQWQAFPRATGDAVHSGIMAALCGAIQQQHARLAAVSAKVPKCLLTGGGAEMLLSHLTVAAEHVPALVLEGIDRVASEGVSG